MRTPLLTLAMLVAVPAQAQSGGFSADDLAAAARESVAETAPAAATAHAAARSERLRAVLAAAMNRAAGLLAAEERRALTIALGPPTKDRDILLSWLMRGGTVAAASPELTGIYNPFADGWLVLRWQQVGGVPRLADAGFVTGTVLRGGDPAPLDTAIPFSQALVARNLQSLGAFAQLAEQLGADQFFTSYALIRPGQTEAVLASASAQVGALAQWSRDNPQALSQLNRAIERADDPALLAFPNRVRDALGPASLVSTPEGTELVLQSPVYPARSLFVRFAGGREPELFALDLLPATGSSNE